MLNPVITVMVKAARQGGNVLLRNINKLDSLNVVEKGRMDYASEVDADAEKAVIKELKRGYPDYSVLGEEGGGQAGKNGRYTWAVSYTHLDVYKRQQQGKSKPGNTQRQGSHPQQM